MVRADLDTLVIRQIAVESDTDVRSVEKRIRGERVRGRPGERIDRVLRQHGIEPTRPGSDEHGEGSAA